MSSKYENVFEILSIPLALYMAYDKSKLDGKIDVSDIQYLMGPLLKLPTAIEGADLALKELQAIDADSRSKMLQRLSAEFDISDDVLEGKIEASTSWILATAELVGVLKKNG